MKNIMLHICTRSVLTRTENYSRHLIFLYWWFICAQDQYRYLHHALVHTLTLPWEPVKVDNFPQYMQQNNGAYLQKQFKVLHIR